MPQNDQTATKENFYNWYKDRNSNLCCYNRLILESSMILTKIRIMEWKAEEG